MNNSLTHLLQVLELGCDYLGYADLLHGGQPFVGDIGVCHRGALKESPGDETQFFSNFWNLGGSDQIDLEK